MTVSVYMVCSYDAVVIGAGPAGLSAAAEITASGGRCLLIEQGPPLTARDRGSPDELLSGVGGAGLFSDGKHSFFPAATELWRLPDRGRLARAIERTSELLARHGVIAPPLPPRPISRPPSPVARSWQTKSYPSIYAPLHARLACIKDLYAQSGEPPWLHARVRAARRLSPDGPPCFELGVEQRGERLSARAGSLVVATGRLSPTWIRPWLNPLGVSWRFLRLEFGVRIETVASAELFTALHGVDPKLSWTDPAAGLELRTFCTCREASVLLGRSFGLSAFSGCADTAATGRSSVGLMVRTTDAALARLIGPEVLAKGRSPLRVALCAVLAARGAHPGLIATFGERGATLTTYALHRFLERFGELARDPRAEVYAPCIEGVGEYPVDRSDLELAPGVFVAGDACGRFRGIVAAMVSGRYVGQSVSALRLGRP